MVATIKASTSLDPIKICGVGVEIIETNGSNNRAFDDQILQPITNIHCCPFMNSPSPLGTRPPLPLWLPNTALVLTLLIALVRAGSVSTTPFALVIAVLAVLNASALAVSEKEGGSLAWGGLIKHLLGPVVLPVYGLAAAGMLYLGSSSGPGLNGAAPGGMHAHAATQAAPSLCGGSCGSGAGCGSGGCGASGGKGGACGCGAGKKTQTAAKATVSAAELQARAAAVQQRAMQTPLPGIQMTPPAGTQAGAVPLAPARSLPPGLVPKKGVPLPPGLSPAPPATSSASPVNASATPAAVPAPVAAPSNVPPPAAAQPPPPAPVPES